MSFMFLGTSSVSEVQLIPSASIQARGRRGRTRFGELDQVHALDFLRRRDVSADEYVVSDISSIRTSSTHAGT